MLGHDFPIFHSQIHIIQGKLRSGIIKGRAGAEQFCEGGNKAGPFRAPLAMNQQRIITRIQHANQRFQLRARHPLARRHRNIHQGRPRAKRRGALGAIPRFGDVDSAEVQHRLDPVPLDRFHKRSGRHLPRPIHPAGLERFKVRSFPPPGEKPGGNEGQDAQNSDDNATSDSAYCDHSSPSLETVHPSGRHSNAVSILGNVRRETRRLLRNAMPQPEEPASSRDRNGRVRQFRRTENTRKRKPIGSTTSAAGSVAIPAPRTKITNKALLNAATNV